MIKYAVFLALLLAGPLRAEPFGATPPIDQRMIADVTEAALSFMRPRTLDEIGADQLSLWGLRGLTAIDPHLTVDRQGGALRLMLRGATVYTAPLPEPPDFGAWGDLIAHTSRAAWDVSEPVRRAGTRMVIQRFFGDLLNHLDPYSRYASPQDAESEANRRNGRAGIGIELGQGPTGFVVRAVTQGSPAASAGIRPGDRLTEIDEQPLDGADLIAARALLAGPEDTRVILTLRGSGLRKVVLTRTILTQQSVFAQRRGPLLVLRISGFVHDTAARLAAELGRIGAMPGLRAVVIDLRGNRGGLLRQAIAAAETLLPSGRLASTEGRDPAATQVFDANGADLTHGMKLIVLVDGGTASAAEILAASLADRRRAVVIGSSTLGKGLVQTIYPLPDQGALSLTWSRVLAPSGWPLQALGVMPQLCTSLGEEALHRQLTNLAAGQLDLAPVLARHHAARAPVDPEEVLQLRNACPAAEGRDSDLAAARMLAESAQAYSAALLP